MPTLQLTHQKFHDPVYRQSSRQFHAVNHRIRSHKYTSFQLITDYYDARYKDLDGATLLARAKQKFVSMKVSDSESRLIEQSTKLQRESDYWFMYHEG